MYSLCDPRQVTKASAFSFLTVLGVRDARVKGLEQWLAHSRCSVSITAYDNYYPAEQRLGQAWVCEDPSLWNSQASVHRLTKPTAWRNHPWVLFLAFTLTASTLLVLYPLLVKELMCVLQRSNAGLFSERAMASTEWLEGSLGMEKPTTLGSWLRH